MLVRQASGAAHFSYDVSFQQIAKLLKIIQIDFILILFGHVINSVYFI